MTEKTKRNYDAMRLIGITRKMLSKIRHA